MAISSINNSIDTFIPSIVGTYEPEASKAEDSGSQSFSTIFQDILQNTVETEAASNESSMAILANEDISLHDAMIAGTEAELSLRLTLEIRNKVVEAYNEIMRMQV